MPTISDVQQENMRAATLKNAAAKRDVELQLEDAASAAHIFENALRRGDSEDRISFLREMLQDILTELIRKYEARGRSDKEVFDTAASMDPMTFMQKLFGRSGSNNDDDSIQ